MKLNKRTNLAGLGVAIACFGIQSPASAQAWTTTKSKDQFTDIQSCRITPGSRFSRSMVVAILEWGAASYFFVEKHGDELRIGVTSDTNLPSPAEIQVRVDAGPVVSITAADTPLDLMRSNAITPMPNLPAEAQAAFGQTMQNMYATMSPYRVLTGDKAKDLLRQILNGKKAIWRPVYGVNIQDSQPVEIRIAGLRAALDKCGITL